MASSEKERPTRHNSRWSRLCAQATPPQQQLLKLTLLPQLIITPISHNGGFAKAGLRRTV